MKRILIVEDERLILWSLHKTLVQEDDYQIFLAGGAEEAFEIMARYVLDLIITDIKLPGKSGWEILDKVKELSPSTKSIVISASSQVDLEKEARLKGVNFWFAKPVPLIELKDRVRRLI